MGLTGSSGISTGLTLHYIKNSTNTGARARESGKSLPSQKGCPFDCGICSNHLTGTLLANIDLTNRCNMACPICFADAGGRVYEPTLDQVRAMMQVLRSEEPVPCPAVQFSGGEPTVRDDLPEIVAMAKQMGFSQIQLATNGLRLAASLDLCRSSGEERPEHRLPAVRRSHARAIPGRPRGRFFARQAQGHRELPQGRPDKRCAGSNTCQRRQ